MARVEGGTIFFSDKAEVKKVKKLCPDCRLNRICTGPDGKTNSAEVYPVMTTKLTDQQIVVAGDCLPKD